VTVLLVPPNTMPRIDRIWAYLSRDVDGNEGVCAAPIGPAGMCVPMIAADEKRLVSLTPIAELLARSSGLTIVLVEFSERSELREIRGRSA
jgi:hypothetical protein